MQAGYSISASGDIVVEAPRAHGQSFVGQFGSNGGAHSAPGGTVTSFFSRHSVLSEGPGQHAVPVPFLSLSGGSNDGGQTGTQPATHMIEALPPVEVTNPVLANLELANSLDPRRHKRTDSKLSSLSIGSLHR